jgi:hypothetical protein
MNIEDIICQSIMSINNPELRKKLSNSIILVGGSSKFKGMIDYLEDRLIDKITTQDQEIDRVEIIHFPGIDNKTISWIGATIIPKLDSSKDMWISRDRWLGEYEKEELALPIINTVNQEAGIVGDKPVETKKKKDRHLDGGVRLIREKGVIQW